MFNCQAVTVGYAGKENTMKDKRRKIWDTKHKAQDICVWHLVACVFEL